jgi:hypothetical protein
MKRDEILAEARRYIALKTPWRHRGRNERGLDCAGLAVVLLKHFELPCVDIDGYSRFPQGQLFVDHLRNQFDLGRPPLNKGQIVVLRDVTRPCHVGLLGERYGRLSLIHASAEHMCCFEEDWTPLWATKLRMILEFPGVED